MNTEANQKVTASHLKRCAYLYVRQSTMRQVLENTESTQRQYALQKRAIALGWPHALKRLPEPARYTRPSSIFEIGDCCFPRA